MMLRKGYSVTEAATTVGYSSLSHFISEFRHHFGETPRIYLQRLWDVRNLDLRDLASADDDSRQTTAKQ
jgi:AraC-like DNA-binding protein